MDGKILKAIQILRAERKNHMELLEELQIILCDLEEDCCYIPTNAKKYIDTKKVKKDARILIQTIADLDCIIIDFEAGKNETQIIGSLYEGKFYSELTEVLTKADLSWDEENMTVSIE